MNQRWLPTTFTPPLSDEFVSDGPRLRKFVDLFCRDDSGKPLQLTEWQAWFIDHILERYPDDWHDKRLAGQLRYRYILLSIARGNGKSEIAKVLGFYGLMMGGYNPLMIGLASNADQAGIIYRNIKKDIDASADLRRRFKTTGTRGITRLDKPGYYQVKPAKAGALQGLQLTMCLFDEVHLCDRDMWAAMVAGARSRDGVVIGLTTAGDDTSVLLKDLYELGRQAAAGNGDERFGFFLWEGRNDDVEDVESLLDANPSVVCGLQSVEDLLTTVRNQPVDQARRYHLNRFISSESAWLPAHMWRDTASDDQAEGAPTFSIDRTPSWEHATITATYKTATGVYSEVVASVVKPTLESLLGLAERLYAHSPRRYVMDGYTLPDLARELQRRGYPVKVIRGGDVANACSTAYALIASGKATHADDELLNRQMPFAIKKNYQDAWKISRASSSVDIDAVMATVYGIYATAVDMEGDSIQIY